MVLGPWRPAADRVHRLTIPRYAPPPSTRLEAPGLITPNAVCTPVASTIAGPAIVERLQPPQARSAKPERNENRESDPGSEWLPSDTGSDVDGPGYLAELLWAILQPPIGLVFASDGVLEWPAPIRPFQMSGVQVLLDRAEVLLADEMGLGKTVQTIAALRVLAFRGLIEASLVVCPATLIIQWHRELGRWAPELVTRAVRGRAEDRAMQWRLHAHVYIVSYETLRGDVLDVRDSPALRRRWDVVVLDEASRIKNRDTDVSRACRRLPRSRRWALTGTPLENRPEDVASILEFLFGDPEQRHRVDPDPLSLRGDLSRVQLRRKKADVLPELPPKDIHDIVLELPEAQRRAYDEAEQRGILRLREFTAPVTIVHVLELIARLKQLCNHEPVSSESGKLNDLENRLAEIVDNGERALIFSQYTDRSYGARWLAASLSRFNPVLYTGDMSGDERQRQVDAFMGNRDRKVMVLSLRAGGMGLNLQSASYVFHFDRWWNPAIESQAEDRAHRMGRTTPVTVYRYICANTIEERIDARLREKRALFSEVVDGVSLDVGQMLSEEELFGLFGLQPPGAAGQRRT